MFITGCAGLQPVREANTTFGEVYKVGASKEQIFNVTKIWIAETFRSAKAVIEYEDKVEGTIIGNGMIPYPCTGLACMSKASWKVPFTMRVDIKDQKFKLTFSNIRLSWGASYNSVVGVQSAHDGPVSLQGDMDAIKPKLLVLGSEIVDAIQKNSKTKDW